MSPRYRDPRFAIWHGIKDRCFDSRHHAFHRYGGRGVTMCERWRQSFDDFCADVGPRPARMTIDRIDNERGYEPGNVRWATYTEQNRNRSDTRLLTAFGRTQCVAEWATELGISRAAIAGRLRRGWPVEKALGLRRTQMHRRFSSAETSRECLGCRETKPLTDFTKCARSRSGRGGRCHECHNRDARERARRSAAC